MSLFAPFVRASEAGETQLRAAQNSVRRLKAALQGDREDQRFLAVDILVCMKAQGVSILCGLLQHENVVVRRTVVLGLCRLATEASGAVEALAAALEDPDADVRSGAAAALKQLGVGARPASSQLLRAALADQDWTVRGLAAAALASFGREGVPGLAEALMDRSPFRSTNAAEALAGIGPDASGALSALIGALEHSEASTRAAVANALGRVAPDSQRAVAALAKALGDSDDNVAGYAAGSLARMHHAEAASPALVQSLARESLDGRTAHAFECIGRPAVPVLAQALQNADSRIRSNAAFILGRMGMEAEQAIPALIAALRGDDKLSAAAAAALGRIGIAAIFPLLRALKEPDRVMRRCAATALGYFTWGSSRRSLSAAAEPAATTGQTIGEVPEVLAALRSALGDPDHSVRTAAAKALECVSAIPVPVDSGRVGEPVGEAGRGRGEPGRVPSALIRGFRADIPYGGIAALHEAGDGAVPALVAAMGDSDARIRYWAVAAIKALGEKARDTLPALLVALRDDSAAVRRGAASALGSLPFAAESTVPRLVEALEDTDTGVRQNAVEALASFGPAASGAVPRLIAALGDSAREISGAAVSALSQIGDASVPALRAALRDERAIVRRRAFDALRFMPEASEQVVLALVEALEDADLRMEAGVALRWLEPKAREVIPSRWQDFVSKAFIDSGSGC